MKIKKLSLAQFTRAWENFKELCDNHTVIEYKYSSKSDEFISTAIHSPVTYTLKGFCNFLGLSQNAFYQKYNRSPAFQNFIERIEDECETNVRRRFEDGTLPTALAPLWMSRYGYSTKSDTNISANIPVIISGDDLLED